jgi:hypothetical protein
MWLFRDATTEKLAIRRDIHTRYGPHTPLWIGVGQSVRSDPRQPSGRR